MTQDYINFKILYDKLKYDIFPTIRGKSWYKKINIGDIRKVGVDRQRFGNAKLIYKKIMKIGDIPLDFLKWDTSPHETRSYDNFCGVLNSFYPRNVYPQLEATIETEVTILFFEKES